VQIYLDQNRVYDAVTTTNHILGIANSLTTTEGFGRHKLKVVVDKADSAETDFPLHKELYIGISHNGANGVVSFQIQAAPFLYD
jgi:hypothetical protein